MGRLFAKIAVDAIAIAATAALLPGIELGGGLVGLLWVTLLFLVVNLVLKPIVELISLPLIIVTLGLFALVVNAALLLFTAWLTEDLEVDGFWTAVLGAVVISVVVAVTEAVTSPD